MLAEAAYNENAFVHILFNSTETRIKMMKSDKIIMKCTSLVCACLFEVARSSHFIQSIWSFIPLPSFYDTRS